MKIDEDRLLMMKEARNNEIRNSGKEESKYIFGYERQPYTMRKIFGKINIVDPSKEK